MGLIGKFFGAPESTNNAFESLLHELWKTADKDFNYPWFNNSPAFRDLISRDSQEVFDFYLFLLGYNGKIPHQQILEIQGRILSDGGKGILGHATFPQLLQILRIIWPQSESWYMPTDQILKLIESRFEKFPEDNANLRKTIEDCLSDPTYGRNADLQYHFLKKYNSRINKLLALQQRFGDSSIALKDQLKFARNDSFYKSISDYATNLSNAKQSALVTCLRLGIEAKSSTPNKKFVTAISEAFAPVRAEADLLLIELLQRLANLEPRPDAPKDAYAPLLHESNAAMARSLIWAASILGIPPHKAPFEKLALFFGPSSVLLTNAALYALAASAGDDGFAALSRLRHKLKQRNFRTMIEKHLAEAAQKRGISINELEDSLASDFGLRDGTVTLPVGSVQAEIMVTGAAATLVWKDKAGATLKAIPPKDKEADAAGFKKAKNTFSDIGKNLTIQKNRFENYLRDNLEITYPKFEKRFLEHGLLSCIARYCIWNFRTEKTSHTVVSLEDAWRDVNGKLVKPTAETVVSLWHPVEATTNEITAWRSFMVEHGIRQPVKQAFREVYTLTPPEAETRVYSNRMAAHIIRQYQFHALARDRGYRYTMAGNFDHGSDLIATLDLPEKQLQAQFWVNEIHDATAPADSIMQPYVATDQVKFVSLQNREPIPLADIPLRLFSEIMRDADMFVGVCSVGNDPNWRDSGGVRAFDNYWESYAFGILSQVAITRRDALTRLLPSLRIAEKCALQDKFLRVQGTRTAYKIHLGSTNILMEPDDRYLCIVPAQSDASTKKIFLPFDDDRGLSVILSKAFLLAADDKIKDETILQQIKRK